MAPIPELKTYRPNVNLTGCQGWLAAADLPPVMVQKHLPPAYTTRSAFVAFAQVVLRGNNCSQVSVDDVDMGPASLQYVFVPVQKPADTPDRPGLRYNYVFELGTNNHQFGDWLGRWMIPVKSANLSGTPMPLPSGEFSSIKGEVTLNGTLAYSFDGLIQKANQRVPGPERFFFGPNPTRDYIDSELLSHQSGAQKGELKMAPGSVMSGLIEDHEVTVAGLQTVTTSYRTLEPPADRRSNEG